MQPRFYLSAPIPAGSILELSPGAARHVQVLRMQPGQSITLFDGTGGEWGASIERMTRSAVSVQVLEHRAIEREAARAVHLAVGLMAADRMDWLVEKAVELGAASLTPIMNERTQHRLSGERAERKMAHWQSIVAAASEQCGRNRLMALGPPLALEDYLCGSGKKDFHGKGAHARWLLSGSPGAMSAGLALKGMGASEPLAVLSGPEGGLTSMEMQWAQHSNWSCVSLGQRVLRAETAPISALVISAEPSHAQ